MIRTLTATALLLCAATTTACSKDPCADANFKLDAPKVCMKLPDGYKAGQPYDWNGGKQVDFEGPGTKPTGYLEHFSLFWTTSHHEKDVDGYVTQNTSFSSVDIKDKGDVPGRKGAKFYWTNDKNGPMGSATVYMQGQNEFFECQAHVKKELMQPLVDACKKLGVQ